MVADGIRERLNVIALKAGRVGLFQAFDLRRDRPDVWQKLITTGAASLTLTADDLPYYTSSRAIAIIASRILARVKGVPASYGITVAGAPIVLNAPAEPELASLLSSTVLGIALDTALTIAAPLPSKIEEMILIVNYTMTP
jgi:hypothetical protein